MVEFALSEEQEMLRELAHEFARILFGRMQSTGMINQNSLLKQLQRLMR